MSYYRHQQRSEVPAATIIDFDPHSPTHSMTRKPRVQLSIFDFDGTLFKSPSPSEAALAKFSKLTQPTFAGGLGWFQSMKTLSPPIVPLMIEPISTSTAVTGGSASASASPAAFDKWFIAPTVAAYLEAKQRGDVTMILTGREKVFASRVGALLSSAGFNFDRVILKQNPRGGTVRHKVDTFLSLIREFEPTKIVYYEDRPEQGNKIISELMAVFKAGHSTAYDVNFEISNRVAKYYYDDNHSLGDDEEGASKKEGEGEKTKEGGGGNFKMIMIDPSLSDTLLPPAEEEALLAELLRDAKEAAAAHRRGASRGRGRW